MIEALHEHHVKSRRIQRLGYWLDQMIRPEDQSLLDVGTGDGRLLADLAQRHPRLKIEGIDLLVRPDAAIAVRPYDGTHFPYPDQSFDIVSFVDVLHHTPDPAVLLREACRVARRAVIIKDHRVSGFLARPTLRFMDGVGNARFGVALPYNYWTPTQWHQTFAQLHLTPALLIRPLHLYPAWADWLFGRDLHFIARLQCKTP